MNTKATIVENIPFTIEPVRILREMRIPKITTLEEIKERPLADAIKGAIDTGYSLIRGRGIYKTIPVTSGGNGVIHAAGHDHLFTGGKLVELLSECDYATVLACTIGPDLENEVERLQQEDNNMTGAYALEMVGGWMADYMADRLDERIERDIARAGYGRTMRFSPGYGAWPLTAQELLLPLVEAERIGIELTDTDIMIPRKSVSAVIGWQRG
jgi:hypothetical protein